jgi:hypothetical protein
MQIVFPERENFTPPVVGTIAKVAVAEVAVVMVRVQEEVPEQAPLQPVNDDPDAAEAVRVTEAPEAKAAEQVVPQLIPAGDEVTVPAPVPASEMDSV